ncbi:MAG: nickel-type superoxide dismutase maturation protease [Actinomycetota bacterium]
MENELPEANWKEKVLFKLGKRRAVLVEGDSMLPTLKNGDGILIDADAVISEGDIVLAKHPFKKSVIILKRLAEIDENGNYFLVGDNPAESTDSRTFGAISAKHILGKAVCRLKN